MLFPSCAGESKHPSFSPHKVFPWKKGKHGILHSVWKTFLLAKWFLQSPTASPSPTPPRTADTKSVLRGAACSTSKHLQQMWGCASLPSSTAPFPSQSSSPWGASYIQQSREIQSTASHQDFTAEGKLRKGAGEDVQIPWVVPEVSGSGSRAQEPIGKTDAAEKSQLRGLASGSVPRHRLRLGD